MALPMTCGVIMQYYAQHTRPITDSKRACERCCGAAAPLPAGRAVNELRAASSRLAQARQLVAGLNDKSATMTDRDDDKPNCNRKGQQVCENLLIRSIRNYHKLAARLQKTVQASTLPRVMLLDCTVCEGVIVKGGYPFMFISPFDLKLQ